MSRLDDAFARRAAEGRKVLVTYLAAGDPDEAESVELAVACAESGADVLELGCPFSDPSADGPAIARAGQRSLARGGGLASTLRVAAAIRARTDAPTVLFGYYNPIFVHGEANLVADAKTAGIDALLVVDLPLDEASSLRTRAASSGLGVIPLVAPTSTAERIASIATLAATSLVPFVYYVSMTGVTGGAGATDVLRRASAAAGEVRRATGRPTVVGFGIDSPESARVAAEHADGVVIGSALVRRVEEGKTASDRLQGVRALVAGLRSAV